MGTTGDDREYLGAEEHLDEPDAAACVVDVSPEHFSDRVAVVDPEALGGAHREAGLVLVEGHVLESRVPGHTRTRSRIGFRRGVIGLGLGLRVGVGVGVGLECEIRESRREGKSGHR